MYQKQLQDDEEALAYLKVRGITKEAQDYFALGVVREPAEGHDLYKNRISFPYETPSGIVSIRFRAIGPPGDRAKFMSMPGDTPRIYNTRALIGTREVFICEGETDTIAAWQAGLPSVGLPGASTWHKSGRVFSRVFANRSVCVLADNDDAGAGLEFAQDIYKSLGGCRIVLLPKGHDVSSFLLERGENALKEIAHPR